LLLLHLHRLARWLRPLLRLSRLVGFAAVIVAVFLLLRDIASTAALALTLGLSLWALMLDAGTPA
jgi:hypothetical protein